MFLLDHLNSFQSYQDIQSPKHQQLKKHTEDAGMKVEEKNGKIVVKKKKPKK